MFLYLFAVYAEKWGGVHIYRGGVHILHVGTYAHEHDLWHLDARFVLSAESRWRHFLSCSQQARCFDCAKRSMQFQLNRHWCDAGGRHCDLQIVYCMPCENCLQWSVHFRPCYAVSCLAVRAVCNFQKWSVPVYDLDIGCQQENILGRSRWMNCSAHTPIAHTYCTGRSD